MSVYAIGTIFVQLTPGMNAFVTAQGFTKISMLSVITGAVTNIILDQYLYIAKPIADIIAVTFTAILLFVKFRKSLYEIETA